MYEMISKLITGKNTGSNNKPRKAKLLGIPRIRLEKMETDYERRAQKLFYNSLSGTIKNNVKS